MSFRIQKEERPGRSAGALPMASRSHCPRPSVAGVLEALGLELHERISLNWKPSGRSTFKSLVTSVAGAPAKLAQLQDQACVWFGVNPVNLPVGRGRRGDAEDVTRLADMVAELDYDKGVTVQARDAVVAELSELFIPPTLLVDSGHGLHLHWRVIDGQISDEFTLADAKVLLAQFHRLFDAVVAKHGVQRKQDNVFDLPRIMRMPGTTNHKNPDAPVPVTVRCVDTNAFVMVGPAGDRIDQVLAKLSAPATALPDRPLLPAPCPGGSDYQKRVTAYIESIAGRQATLAQGSRNGDQNEGAFYAFQLALGAGISLDWVESAIWQAQEANGQIADDGEHQVRATMQSARRGAERNGPAYLEDRSLDPGPLGNTDFGPADPAVPVGDESDDGPLYTDFAALLSEGLPEPPEADLLHRVDGVGLFYRGKRNELYGDPESGKTMIAAAAMAAELNTGGRVLFIDLDNNGPAETAERMLMLGAARELLIDRDRFRHCQPDDWADLAAVIADCDDWPPAMAVIDCVGELIPLGGGSSNSADDYTQLLRQTSGRLEKLGAGVILIDHPAKGADSRAYGASGTMAKRRAVAGISLEAVIRKKFTRGRGGACELRVNKDRPGGVRQHCPNPSSGSRQQYAGTFELDPPGDDDVAAWRVTTFPPAEAAQDVDPERERHYQAAMAIQREVPFVTISQVAARVNNISDLTAVGETKHRAAERHIKALVVDERMRLVRVKKGREPARYEVVVGDE